MGSKPIGANVTVSKAAGHGSREVAADNVGSKTLGADVTKSKVDGTGGREIAVDNVAVRN